MAATRIVESNARAWLEGELVWNFELAVMVPVLGVRSGLLAIAGNGLEMTVLCVRARLLSGFCILDISVVVLDLGVALEFSASLGTDTVFWGGTFGVFVLPWVLTDMLLLFAGGSEVNGDVAAIWEL